MSDIDKIINNLLHQYYSECYNNDDGIHHTSTNDFNINVDGSSDNKRDDKFSKSSFPEFNTRQTI